MIKENNQSTVSTQGNIKQIKLILLGESRVGKTSILDVFTKGATTGQPISTIGVDYRVKDYTIESQQAVKLQIWDTSGQEKFRSLSKSFYKGAEGVLLVFDLNCADSFHKIQYWYQSIQENSQNNVTIVLVGNKSDLQQAVTEKEILTFCDQYRLQFFRTSAVQNTGITELFNHVAKETYKMKASIYAQSIKQSHLKNSVLQKSVKEDEDEQNFKKKKCC